MSGTTSKLEANVPMNARRSITGLPSSTNGSSTILRHPAGPRARRRKTAFGKFSRRCRMSAVVKGCTTPAHAASAKVCRYACEGRHRTTLNSSGRLHRAARTHRNRLLVEQLKRKARSTAASSLGCSDDCGCRRCRRRAASRPSSVESTLAFASRRAAATAFDVHKPIRYVRACCECE